MANRAEPTKANLIRLTRESSLAHQGLEILDKKREVLLRELSSLVLIYEERYNALAALLAPLYKRAASITASLGPRGAAYETIPVKGSVRIRSADKRMMGVKTLELAVDEVSVPKHLLSDDAGTLAEDFSAILPELVFYIQAASAMKTIALEVSKTQKREKAIEQIHIPSYEKQIAFIRSTLDENERNELVRYKTLKRRLKK